MCGYYYSYNVDIDLNAVDSIKRRGPEQFDTLRLQNENFGHSLLNTRGETVPQPLQNDHGILLYNGSTYNSVTNDTIWISSNLDQTLNRTIDLIKNLQGEYSLTYVTQTHIVFCVDQWATKNLYFYYDEDAKKLLIASEIDVVLGHAPGAVRAVENQIYIINKFTFELDIIPTTQWNFSQKTNNYDQVFENFEKAVQLRHEQNITTYMLSGGFDSGVITCCANKYFNNDLYTVTKAGREDVNVVGARLKLHKHKFIEPSNNSAEAENTVKDMFKSCNQYYIKTNSALALTGILQHCLLPKKQKIIISGIGGDELYDDYTLDKKTHGRVGKINGSWPTDLRTVFPWHNYERTQLLLQLARSDTVCGYHGIEARYPLLDQKLFQSWLNTTVKLKNKSYKDWMRHYMKDHNYPISKNTKIGFGS